MSITAIKGVDFIQYGADDVGRAVAFYREHFGLVATGYAPGGGWAELDLGNATLPLIGPPHGHGTQEGTGRAVALAVVGVGAALAALRARGVRVVFGPIDTPVSQMGMILDSEEVATLGGAAPCGRQPGSRGDGRQPGVPVPGRPRRPGGHTAGATTRRSCWPSTATAVRGH
jgi:predicted enzyme related to lactoylglutathione lyase